MAFAEVVIGILFFSLMYDQELVSIFLYASFKFISLDLLAYFV